MHLFTDVRVARWSLRHQPSRQVDRVAEARERTAHRMAVRTAAHAAVGDADLQIRRGRFPVERQQLDRCPRRPGGVVLVRVRRAEHSTEVRALVAEDHVQEVAAEIREDVLHASNEVIELRDRVGIVVVVDAAETHEHRVRGAELGEELAAAGHQSLVHRRQDPRTNQRLAQWR